MSDLRKVPLPPVGFNPDTFFAGTYWHQRWEMFQRVYTPGINSIEMICNNLELPLDLSGKRVLDIGAWNGCLSFECERRGAREVVAIGPEDPTRTAFYKIRDAIGSTRTQYRYGSVYNLDPDVIGLFDIVLFCGVLYHLRYPLLGIDNLRRICTGDVYVETHLIDNCTILREGDSTKDVPLADVSPQLVGTPIWQFYRLADLNNDYSNWVGPNSQAVIQAFESAGFQTNLLKLWGHRGSFHARVKAAQPEFLTIQCGENVYYDTLISHLFGRRERSAPAGFLRRLASKVGLAQPSTRAG